MPRVTSLAPRLWLAWYNMTRHIGPPRPRGLCVHEPGRAHSVEREEKTMHRSQITAPPAPGLGVGTLMARRDRPYPGNAIHPLAMITLVVGVVLIGAFALLQHQAADVAFQTYALKTSFVGVSSLASHPERYREQLVHTRGETGDVVLTDSGRQVIVSLPTSTEGTGNADAQILMLTEADVPAHSLVDIWGTCAGTVSLAGSARQGSHHGRPSGLRPNLYAVARCAASSGRDAGREGALWVTSSSFLALTFGFFLAAWGLVAMLDRLGR